MSRQVNRKSIAKIRESRAKEYIEQKKQERLDKLMAKPIDSLNLKEASLVVYLLSRELEKLDREEELLRRKANKMIKAYYERSSEVEELKAYLENRSEAQPDQVTL
ncbi:hypothetical protein PA598K_01480 [Paenibacillus sp. 598K]|uniref:hypothetical protein n=1 Tax=Paenibacillus sp. 598K TaxID=1117987 RepID=UPI000FF9B037|nr:hypothetical protein [Paenibacillus sp. 598K]GBF73195.1 hypothetical protein PA598K_01480 [Paenibacillus sp. 598K]